MKASLAFTSNEILATRPKLVMLLLFTAWCGAPISIRNFPSWVNLRMKESTDPLGHSPLAAEESEQVPFPPIQTLSLLSIEIPWLDSGQSCPAAGPPQEFTRLPSGSNSRIGGAAAQHSPVCGLV